MLKQKCFEWLHLQNDSDSHFLDCAQCFSQSAAPTESLRLVTFTNLEIAGPSLPNFDIGKECSF